MVHSMKNNTLTKDCASILESVKVSDMMSVLLHNSYDTHCITVQYITTTVSSIVHIILAVEPIIAPTYFSILQLYAEAGALYEKSQCWDKAATVYTKIKNW